MWKFFCVMGAFWVVMGLIRILLVESWAFPPDGDPLGWWNVIGLRFLIGSLHFLLASYVKQELGGKDERI